MLSIAARREVEKQNRVTLAGLDVVDAYFIDVGKMPLYRRHGILFPNNAYTGWPFSA